MRYYFNASHMRFRLSFLTYTPIKQHTTSALADRVTLLSMAQFSIFDKNKGNVLRIKDNEFCLSTLLCSLLVNQITQI